MFVAYDVPAGDRNKFARVRIQAIPSIGTYVRLSHTC